jgi:NAD(P)-dependent dehydrogenase (short-subunit alcohol dehydrogenase family)
VPTALVTGANKGLGLEHVRQFAGRGWKILACARKCDAPALVALAEEFGAQFTILPLDVTDHVQIDRLASEMADDPIDVLINNAGSTGPQGFPECIAFQGLDNTDFEIWKDIFAVNLLGAFKVATAFRRNIVASTHRLLVNMSSDLGSVEQNETGQLYAYRSSKAGLNMITKGMAVEWPDITTIAMAPGWCRTEIGGDDAGISPVDSVREQQRVFERLTHDDSGRFIDRFGETVPW